MSLFVIWLTPADVLLATLFLGGVLRSACSPYFKTRIVQFEPSPSQFDAILVAAVH